MSVKFREEVPGDEQDADAVPKERDAMHGSLSETMKSERSPERSSCRDSQAGTPSLRDSMTSLDTLRRSTGKKVSFDWKSFMQERAGGDITKRYDIDATEFASGFNGKVFMATDRNTQKQVAIKKVPKQKFGDPKQEDAFYKEVTIMKDLDHPNICKLLETYDQDGFMYFVMECCHGGEIFERIKEKGGISEQMTADIVKQVASALRYAHTRGIAHRDLKPENICFCDKGGTQVKVIDWGLGFYFDQNLMSSAVGTPMYAAPEVLEARQGVQYGSACDIWSLGVLTYVMLGGKPAFWGSQTEQVTKMKNEDYPFKGSPWDSFSKECREFITELLKSDPEKRLPIEKVVEHRWFNSATKDSLLKSEQEEVLANLQQFKNTSFFFSVCAASVARQLDHSSLRNVHKVFADLDSNGDGVLELHEVKAGFENLFGKESAEANQVEDMFEKLDLDGSGTIECTEFSAAGIGAQVITQQHSLWAAFKNFDEDDNGYISTSEITKVLLNSSVQTAFPKSVCDQVAKEIMTQFDANGDGDISFPEWLEMMQGAASGQRPTPSVVATYSSEQQLLEDSLLEDIERACSLPEDIERAGQAGNFEEGIQHPGGRVCVRNTFLHLDDAPRMSMLERFNTAPPTLGNEMEDVVDIKSEDEPDPAALPVGVSVDGSPMGPGESPAMLCLSRTVTVNGWEKCSDWRWGSSIDPNSTLDPSEEAQFRCTPKIGQSAACAPPMPPAEQPMSGLPLAPLMGGMMLGNFMMVPMNYLPENYVGMGMGCGLQGMPPPAASALHDKENHSMLKILSSPAPAQNATLIVERRDSRAVRANSTSNSPLDGKLSADEQRQMDNLIKTLIKGLVDAGVELPENAGKADSDQSHAQKRCRFVWFGTTKYNVKLGHGDGMEDVLLVSVGGGFMNFEEFAKTHGKGAARKLARQCKKSGCQAIHVHP